MSTTAPNPTGFEPAWIRNMTLLDEWGGWGYLGHELRTEATDLALANVAAMRALTPSDVFLWANSRYARHFADAGCFTPADFAASLDRYLPALRAEAQP